MDIRALQGTSDPLLPAWFMVYELSFRQEVRGLAGFLLGLLRDASPQHTFLAAVEAQELTGIALYQEPPALPVGYLWYLAIASTQRGQGRGAQLYHAVLERLRPGTEALFFEVELPERQPDAATRALAERRIHFYQRLGALPLSHARVWEQTAPHFPPEPFMLFAHPLMTRDGQRLMTLAAALYGERLQLLNADLKGASYG